eukprot:GHVS01068965.1.p2 GENE.GHVS01068965.1~~GHVS01068965.1.p2  ORF type:complete len:109 (+),score=36.89 GHVS01068965.1:11-337(+)
MPRPAARPVGGGGSEGAAGVSFLEDLFSVGVVDLTNDGDEGLEECFEKEEEDRKNWARKVSFVAACKTAGIHVNTVPQKQVTRQTAPPTTTTTAQPTATAATPRGGGS